VKQGLRFFLDPRGFFNQLQWSSHHWLILFAFLVTASVESYVGKYHFAYNQYTLLLTHQFGWQPDVAIWTIAAVKLVLLVSGMYLLTMILWAIGSLIGHSETNSKRVLFRRMAVVFTVILLGYTASHLVPVYASLAYVSYFLYAWGGLLGYMAMREQFELNRLEAAMVGAFGLLLLTSTWHFTSTFIDSVAHSQIKAAYTKSTGAQISEIAKEMNRPKRSRR